MELVLDRSVRRPVTTRRREHRPMTLTRVLFVLRRLTADRVSVLDRTMTYATESVVRKPPRLAAVSRRLRSSSSVSSETQPTDPSVVLPQPHGERERQTVSGFTARLNKGEMTDEEYICAPRELATKCTMDYPTKISVLGWSLNNA